MPLMHQDEILGWRLPKAPSSWRCPPAGPQLTRMPGACSSGLPPCRWTKACGGSFVWTAVSLGCAHSCGVRHLAPSRFHLCNWMGCSCFKGAPLTLFTAPWWVEAAGQHSWSKLLHLPVSASCTMLTGFYTDSQLSRNGLLLPGWKPHLRGAGALWGLGHADSPHKHGLCVSHSASLTGAPGGAHGPSGPWGAPPLFIFLRLFTQGPWRRGPSPIVPCGGRSPGQLAFPGRW